MDPVQIQRLALIQGKATNWQRRMGAAGDMPAWTIAVGDGPVVAAAIHTGHEVRPDVAEWLAVPESDRLREEDPLTELWTTVGDCSVRVHRSRFEVDLNRPREKAVASDPGDTWGLDPWRAEPPRHVTDRSLAEYDGFYSDVTQLLNSLTARWKAILVLDLHSYNWRRGGAGRPGDDPASSPQVNVGTGTMNRQRWSGLVDGFIDALRSEQVQGRQLDVRENVKFQGGFFPCWLHHRWPDRVCVLSLEFKKFFMDEWSATASIEALQELRVALRNATNSLRPMLPRSGE